MVTIGNTGVGKSSIIKLLSGKNVKISSKATRGTSEISTIKSKYCKNLYFVDTIGLQDYEKSWTDEKLLRYTLQYIHSEGFRKIKILFCVAGDTDTRMGPFTRPAQFIGNLTIKTDQDEHGSANACNPTEEEKKIDHIPHTHTKPKICYNPKHEDLKYYDDEEDVMDDVMGHNVLVTDRGDHNRASRKQRKDIHNNYKSLKIQMTDDGDNHKASSIWDSVLVIKKRGKGTKRGVKDVSGVIDAAIKKGGAPKRIANYEDHAFGFTCTDWNFDAKQGLYKFLPKKNREELSVCVVCQSEF